MRGNYHLFCVLNQRGCWALLAYQVQMPDLSCSHQKLSECGLEDFDKIYNSELVICARLSFNGEEIVGRACELTKTALSQSATVRRGRVVKT